VTGVTAKPTKNEFVIKTYPKIIKHSWHCPYQRETFSGIIVLLPAVEPIGSKVTFYTISAVSILITESDTRQARGLTILEK
jgi:hypothetical protein